MIEPVPAPQLRKRGMLGGLRASFLTGLIVILPIGLTLYLIWVVTGWIDSWVLPFIPHAWKPETLLKDYFGQDTNLNIRGIGVIVFLFFTVFIGWIAKGIIGRSFLHWTERTVSRLPVVRSVYNGVKQLTETVFGQQQSNFDRACLVEFPHKGVWAIGFVAIDAKGEIAEKLPQEGRVLTVFIAPTPVPTAGFLLFVPEKDVIFLDMRLEDAAKLIISAGLVYPPPREGVVTIPPPARAAE